MDRYLGTRQRFGTGRFGEPGPIQATPALPARPSTRFGQVPFGVPRVAQSVRTTTYKILSIITVSAIPPGATAAVVMPQEEIDKARTLIPRLDDAIYRYSDGMGRVANTTLIWEPTITKDQYSFFSGSTEGYYVNPGKMRALVNADPSYDLVAVWTGTGQTNLTELGLALGLAIQPGYWIHTPYHDIEPTPIHEFGHWIERHLKELGFVGWPVCAETLEKPANPTSMHCGKDAKYGFGSNRSPAWFAAYFSGDLFDNTGMRQAAWDYPRSFPTFQTGKPASDVSVGKWRSNVDSSGVDLWKTLTDPFAKEGAWAYSSASPATSDAYRFKLGSLAKPPTSADHTVRYRVGYNKTSGDTLEVIARLYQGTTLISRDITRVPPDVDYRTFHWTLPPAHVANITNYADLRLDVSAVRTVDVGVPRWVRLTWARLEVPEAEVVPVAISASDTLASLIGEAVALARTNLRTASDDASVVIGDKATLTVMTPADAKAASDDVVAMIAEATELSPHEVRTASDDVAAALAEAMAAVVLELRQAHDGMAADLTETVGLAMSSLRLRWKREHDLGGRLGDGAGLRVRIGGIR